MELKSCQFCGGEAVIVEWYIHGIANKKHYRCECKQCRSRSGWEYKTKARAIEAWNRRAKEAEHEQD